MQKRKTLLAATGVGAALAMALSMPALAQSNNHNTARDHSTSTLNSLTVGDVSVSVPISTTSANTDLSGTVSGSAAGINAGTGFGGPASSGLDLANASTHHSTVGDTGAAYGGGSGGLEVVSSLSNTANGAGIMNVAQNMGASSLIQQGVTVQANMSFNH